jgi:hypothetical protein
VAEGPDRAALATKQAISSPLLDDVDISGARGVLVNITGGPSMTLHEVSEATSLVQKAVGDDANIIFGAVVDEGCDAELRITVIATGFGSERASAPLGREAAAARAELQRLRELERGRPAAQVASITPLARPERRFEPEPHLAPPVPSLGAAAPRVAAPAGPTARLDAGGLGMSTLQATAAPAPTLTSTATAPWLDLQMEEIVEPVAVAEVAPEPEARQPQERHVSLPRPGLPSWSADDLDVPAFLRRQMD